MYKTDSSKIDYDAQINCVTMQWQGLVSLNNMKVGAGQALQLLKDKQAKKFLNNEQAVEGLEFDKQDWVINEWFPQMIDLGLEFYAIVVTADYFDKIPKNQRNNAVGLLKIQYFDSLQKAKEWLI